jgi:hypothetical protein
LRFAVWNSSGDRAPLSRSAFRFVSLDDVARRRLPLGLDLLPAHLVQADPEADATEHHRRMSQGPEQDGAHRIPSPPKLN